MATEADKQRAGGCVFTASGERIEIHAPYGAGELAAVLIYDHETGKLEQTLALNARQIEQLCAVFDEAHVALHAASRANRMLAR